MTEEKKSLVKKLAQIMGNIGSVEKSGFNNFNKYNYTTEADVQAHTSKKMAKENIMLIPYEVSHDIKEVTTRKGNVEHLYTGTWDFKAIDGDSGEELIVRVTGQGQDSGDKAAFKALTGAHKYALMKLFQISTGDDPERDSDNTPEQQNNNKPNYQSQNKQQTQQQQPTKQQQEKELTDLIVNYVKELTSFGVDINQFYAYIANKEGVQSVSEVDKVQVLGYLKAQHLKIKNNQTKQQQQQGSILQDRSTQPATTVSWGSK